MVALGCELMLKLTWFSAEGARELHDGVYYELDLDHHHGLVDLRSGVGTGWHCVLCMCPFASASDFRWVE
jgi:hypothetical protein